MAAFLSTTVRRAFPSMASSPYDRGVRRLLILAPLVVLACTRRDTPVSETPSLVPKAAAAVATPTSAPVIPYRAVGRFVAEPGERDGLRFAWSGSYVGGRFKGTTV